MSPVTPEVRACAEIFTGNKVCKEKAKSLLREYCLPDGLLPVEDVEELGYVKETGLVWVKQKKEIVHNFEKAAKQMSYATEITFYFEKYKIKNLFGVKSDEYKKWLPIVEIYVLFPTDKVIMKTSIGSSSSNGIARAFPKVPFEA